MLEEEVDPQEFPFIVAGKGGEIGGVGDRPDGDQIEGPEAARLFDFDRGNRTVAVNPEIDEGLEDAVGTGIEAPGKPVDRDFIPDAQEIISVGKFGKTVAESLPDPSPAAGPGSAGTDGQAGTAFPDAGPSLGPRLAPRPGPGNGRFFFRSFALSSTG